MSRDSKYSNDTTQSSNAPPSLFGSDKSVFDTPLLTGLPPLSVSSDISSLRTQNTSTTTKSVHRPPIPAQSPLEPEQRHEGLATVEEQGVEEREASLLDSVLSAVSSPVSVGGHKRQSMIIDARSASTEIMQDLQQVKASSPRLVHSQTHSSATSASGSSRSSRASRSSASSMGRRVTTTEVMQSPMEPALSTLSAVDRRAWAASNPTDRPPLSGISEDSMSSSQSRRWEEKMRNRAAESRMLNVENASLRPELTDSPAHARESKSSGGLVPRAERSARAMTSSRISSKNGSMSGSSFSDAVSAVSSPGIGSGPGLDAGKVTYASGDIVTSTNDMATGTNSGTSI
ncbi:hypothetical protein FB639_006077, partial [Coemansia asiatica]